MPLEEGRQFSPWKSSQYLMTQPQVVAAGFPVAQEGTGGGGASKRWLFTRVKKGHMQEREAGFYRPQCVHLSFSPSSCWK